MKVLLVRAWNRAFNVQRRYCQRIARYWARRYLEHHGVNKLLADGNAGEHAVQPVDLRHLHREVRRRKPRIILEFGSGFSTLAMAHALMMNGSGKLWAVDANQDWLDNTAGKITPDIAPFISLCRSAVAAGEVEGEFCHRYLTLPDVTPQFVYLDAPSPKDVTGGVRGLTFRGRKPVAADVLLLESLIRPGFFMVVDGRKENVDFLCRHLKRRYRVKRNRVHFYTTFELIR